MRRFTKVHIAIALFCCISAYASLNQPVSGQDFRVETDVFLGDSDQPVAQTLTLFSNGVVYDFVTRGNKEITVLDLARGRHVFLDTARHRKTTVMDAQVNEFLRQIHQLASDDKPLLKAAADPQYTPRTEDNHWHSFDNDYLSYRVQTTEVPNPRIAERYHAFANASARLNAMLKGGLPPKARIQVNLHVGQLKMVPVEVHRTLVDQRFGVGSKQTVRAKHHFNWSLSKTDKARISQAGDFLVGFDTVGFDEYRSPTPVAKAQNAKGLK